MSAIAPFIFGASVGWLLNEALTRYQNRLQRRLDDLESQL